MLKRAGLFLLVFAGPILLFPEFFSAFVPAALVLLVVSFVIRRLFRGVFIASSILNLPILLLVFIALPVTIWVTPLFEEATWPKLVGLLWAIAVFFEVAAWTYRPQNQSKPTENNPGLVEITAVFLALGTVFTIVGLFGLRTIVKLPLIGQMAASLPDLTSAVLGLPEGIHANELAGTLVLFIPLALSLALPGVWKRKAAEISSSHRDVLIYSGQNRLFVVVSGLVALFMIAALLMTQSRSGLLGFGAALVFMLWFMGRNGRLVLGALVGVALVGFLVIGPARLVSTLLYANSASLQYGPVGLRLEIWRRALRGMADFPLTGMGLGTFRHLLNVLYPWSFPKGQEGVVLDLGHAHNIFFQTALDLGIPAMLLFAGILVGAAVCLLRLYRITLAGSSDRLWVLGAAGGLIAYLVYSLTDAVALGARPGVSLWFLLGLIAAAYNQKGYGRPSARPFKEGNGSGWIFGFHKQLIAAAILIIMALLLFGGRLGTAVSRNKAAIQASAVLVGGEQTLLTAETALVETARYDCPTNWYLGLVYEAQGKTADRDAAFSVLLSCTGRFTSYMAMLLPDNQPLAEFALQVQPDNAAAYFWLGRLLAETSPELAIAYYQQGLAISPREGLYWLELGDLLARTDPQAAIEAYLEACRFGDPGGNGCWRAGQTAEAEGDIAAAIRYYQMSRVGRALERAEQLSR